MAFKMGAEDADANAPIVAEINITPLTDIFLVLLIIFMVTSSALSQQGVEVSLPQASNQVSSAQPDGVIVTLLPDGGVKVNQEIVSADDLSAMEPKLKAAFAKSSSHMVILEGDRKALLGNAIQVMDHARKAGADKFAIATAPESSGG